MVCQWQWNILVLALLVQELLALPIWLLLMARLVLELELELLEVLALPVLLVALDY
jgi:hypothetical protein